MLTLSPGSACDVCAEEYGIHCQPHSIPCGHVLCASCCSTIVEKTPTRLIPVCPFCRENFTGDSIRLIRMDFNNTSGFTAPRRVPTQAVAVESSQADFANMWARRNERIMLSEGCSRTRSEARRLEDKVAKVAVKKCSVEEVSTLHRELQEWLTSDMKDDQTALHLSAALLRAILMNHLAHSEASRSAKITEAHLKAKVDDLEIKYEKTESELRKQRQQYTQKAQEYQTVCAELNRLKDSLVSQDSRQNVTSPTPPSTSPVPPYSPTTQTPLSRFNSVHQRSVSMSSRPSTPATSSPSRSYTPAPPLSRTQTPVPLRTQTPAPPLPRSHTPSIRSHTPAPRTYTPAPVPMLRTTTPAPSALRNATPAPPIPPKPRRLSTPSPQKMVRSTSEEKAEIHQRWIPPQMDDAEKIKYARSPSRLGSYSSSATRYYQSP